MDAIERHKSNLEKIKRFRLVDDSFMTAALSTKECAGELIRTILGKPELKVKNVDNQMMRKNLFGHDSIMDIVAVDEAGKYYNIEVQRSNSGAIPQRARYYSSVLDTLILDKNESYEKMPESYCIFIVENDVFKENSEFYTIDRCITNIGIPFNDGSHIVYFNLNISGDSERAKLAHDFYCTDPEDMYNRVLRERVDFLKNSEEGQSNMCEVSDEIRAEGREEGLEEKAMETARKMLLKKFSFEDIIDCCGLPLSKVQELAKKI